MIEAPKQVVRDYFAFRDSLERVNPAATSAAG
jgi:hypothetical protein